MSKVKISNGYWQAGYGRGFAKQPTIWLIGGKAYAKHAGRTPFQTDIDGYIMCNAQTLNGVVSFYEVGLISEHKQHTSTQP